MRARRLIPLLLLALAAPGLRAADGYDEQLKRAALDYDQRIKQAGDDLARTRQRLAAEKAPLLDQLRAAEDRILTLERDVHRFESVQEAANEQRRKLQKEQESLRRTINYLNTLARDGLKSFNDGLVPGESGALGDQLAQLQQQLDEAAAATTARPAGAVAGFLADWTDRALGGYTAPGRAIDAADNQVREGTFAFFGPEAYFLPAAGGGPSIARMQAGSTYPFAYAIPAWKPADAAAFFAGREGPVPADATGGKALRLKETQGSFAAHIRSGGIVAYVIIATGLIALLIVAQKLLDLARLRLDPPAAIEGVLALVAAGKLAEAGSRLAGLRPATRELLAAGLKHAALPKALLEEQLQLLLHRQQLHFERRLPLLAVIATAAPLMGLLGTVSGMVKTFALITVFGTGNAGKLSAGISEVLVATELGLIVAIPTLVIHGFLAHRIRKNLTLLEHYALELVLAVEQARAARPAGSPPP